MSLPFIVGVGMIGTALIGAATMFLKVPSRSSRRIALALGWFWATGTFYATLLSPSGGGTALNLVPLNLTNPMDLKDFLLNMTGFIPLGALLSSWGIRLTEAVLLGLITSTAIEITQFMTASGRTADVNDILGNSAGTLAGFLAMTGLTRAIQRMRALSDHKTSGQADSPAPEKSTLTVRPSQDRTPRQMS